MKNFLQACCVDASLNQQLPWVLLGLQTIPKEGIGLSAGETVVGITVSLLRHNLSMLLFLLQGRVSASRPAHTYLSAGMATFRLLLLYTGSKACPATVLLPHRPHGRQRKQHPLHIGLFVLQFHHLLLLFIGCRGAVTPLQVSTSTDPTAPCLVVHYQSSNTSSCVSHIYTLIQYSA